MKVYQGKNAIWFFGIFIIYNLLPLIIFMGDSNVDNIWMLTIGGIVYYLGNLLFIPTMIKNKIELYDDYFIFYYGFSKEKIVLKDILELKRSHSILASSANSLDRIHIETKNKELYVALKDNDGFINEVNKRIR